MERWWNDTDRGNLKSHTIRTLSLGILTVETVLRYSI